MSPGRKFAGFGVAVAILAFGYMAVSSLQPEIVVDETVTVGGMDCRLYALEVKGNRRVSVNFRVADGGEVAFLICEEAEFDLWRNGSDVSLCVYQPETTETTVHWVCPADGVYDFVFDNRNSSAAKTVEVTITFR